MPGMNTVRGAELSVAGTIDAKRSPGTRSRSTRAGGGVGGVVVATTSVLVTASVFARVEGAELVAAAGGGSNPIGAAVFLSFATPHPRAQTTAATRTITQ